MNQHTPVKTLSQPVFEAIPQEQIERDGKIYLKNAKGHLVPRETVAAADQLMDEVVRTIMGYAVPLSDQVTRFRRHCYADVNSLLGLLGQNYGVSLGGKKGNLSLTSFDGLMQIKVQNADQVIFGPELQAAKALVDECLREWSSDARAELRTIVTNAFQVDKEGKLNHAALFGLFRYDISDVKWLNAMQALRDSIRVVGSRSYMRFYRRESTDHAWQHITIDMAQA